MVLDKSIETLEDLVRFLNRKQSFYFKLYDRYLEGDHNHLDDSRKHEADCNAVCDDIVECIKAISEEAQDRGIAKKAKVLCTLDGQDEERCILDEWLLKVVRLLDDEANWNRMLAPVEGKDMNNAFDAILFRLTWIANFLKELSTKTEQEYYGGRRTDVMPYYIRESKGRRKPLKELTQDEFNRLARKRDEFRTQTAISPAEKNNLYADIKDFEEEFRDLQDTAERLPDSYIDQVCDTASYPFEVAIDEVKDVEDWCSEAEEFLKDDINNWGIVKEANLSKKRLKETFDSTSAAFNLTKLKGYLRFETKWEYDEDFLEDAMLVDKVHEPPRFTVKWIGPEGKKHPNTYCVRIRRDTGESWDWETHYCLKASDAAEMINLEVGTWEHNNMSWKFESKAALFDCLLEAIEDFPKNTRAMYRFARRRHNDTGAIRKVSKEPYWVHPEGVAKIVMEHGGSDIEIKAAMAHDVLEDTGDTFEDIAEKFGEEVASIVKEVTNDNDEIAKIGKERYISEELCRLSPEALTVKLADMLYNMKDSPTEKNYERMRKNVAFLMMNRHLDGKHLELAREIMEV